MAQRCYAPDNSREYVPIKAVFEDDVEVEIAQFTCGDWALLHQHRAGATGGQAIIHEVYFDKEHVTNRNRIWVTSKTDRHPLMVINENAQQVLQIGIFSFMPCAKTGIHNETKEAYTAAARFMEFIAEKYQEGRTCNNARRAR